MDFFLRQNFKFSSIKCVNRAHTKSSSFHGTSINIMDSATQLINLVSVNIIAITTFCQINDGKSRNYQFVCGFWTQNTTETDRNQVFFSTSPIKYEKAVWHWAFLVVWRFRCKNLRKNYFVTILQIYIKQSCFIYFCRWQENYTHRFFFSKWPIEFQLHAIFEWVVLNNFNIQTKSCLIKLFNFQCKTHLNFWTITKTYDDRKKNTKQNWLSVNDCVRITVYICDEQQNCITTSNR